jgi:hypothetical protein
MLENAAIPLTTAKYAAASFIPSTLIIIGGIVFWCIWRKKQARYQAETDEIKDDIRDVKKQLNELQMVNSKDQPDSSTSQQKKGHKAPGTQDKTGLFEHLINENIQLREQS